jgi:hypothetical protein
MYKSTIEFWRVENHGIVEYHGTKTKPEEHDELDAIVKFMQDKGGHKVYRHLIRTEFEEKVDKYGLYEFRSSNCPPQYIPRGDLVYYLDIYWQ